MGCKECGKPKCNGKCGCKSPKVLQINNPAEYITFHKVSIPAAMGDSTTNPPKIGAYRNALVYYEADHTSWMYSTDGIPTLVTGEQGPIGPQGPAGTIAVGTTTTSEPGTNAEVENVGTPENAILNFTIPRGEQGDQGIQGEPGPQGYMNEQDVRDVVDTIVPEDFFDGDDNVCGSGEKVTLDNVFGTVEKINEIKGNSFQEVYSGGNLYDRTNTVSVNSHWRVLNDGWLNCSLYNDHSNRIDAAYYTHNLNLNNSTQYAVILEVKEISGSGQLAIYSRWAGNQEGQFNGEQIINFSNLAANTTYIYKPTTYAAFNYDVGLRTYCRFEPTEKGSITIRISVIADTTVTSSTFSYEPYVGEEKSPSPSYPQKVKTISGDIALRVVGKNLFDKDNIIVYGGYFGGTPAKINGMSYPPRTTDKWFYIPCLPNTTYTITKPQVQNVSNNRFRIATTENIPKNGSVFLDYWSAGDGTTTTSHIFTTGNNAHYMCIYYAKTSSNADIAQDVLNGIQIEVGDRQTQWEEFSYTDYPISLSDIELARIGSSRDKIYCVGNDWFVHKETGHSIRDISILGIDSNNSGGTGVVSSDGAFSILASDWGEDYASTAAIALLSSNIGTLKIDANVTGNAGARAMEDGTFCPRQGTNDRIYFRNTAYIGKTGSEVKNILSNNIGGVDLWWTLPTSEDNKITDLKLLEQLENASNAIVRDEQSTIEIVSDLTSDLSICAFSENLSGIKETIAGLVDQENKSMSVIFPLYGLDGADTLGDCSIIKNGDKVLMIDTFTDGHPECYESIKNALSQNNIDSIDYLVISHYHGDHIGNVINLIFDGYLDKATIYLPRVAASFPSLDGSGIKNALAVKGLSWTEIDNQVFEVGDDCTVKMLNGSAADYQFYEDTEIGDNNSYNDRSVLCDVSFMGRKLLFTGDAEYRACAHVLPELSSNYDLLKDNHHGLIDLAPDYCAKVNPDFVIIPASAGMVLTNYSDWLVNSVYWLRKTKNVALQGYQSEPIKLEVSKNGIVPISNVFFANDLECRGPSNYYVDYDNASAVRTGSRANPFKNLNEAMIFLQKKTSNLIRIHVLSLPPENRSLHAVGFDHLELIFENGTEFDNGITISQCKNVVVSNLSQTNGHTSVNSSNVLFDSFSNISGGMCLRGYMANIGLRGELTLNIDSEDAISLEYNTTLAINSYDGINLNFATGTTKRFLSGYFATIYLNYKCKNMLSTYNFDNEILDPAMAKEMVFCDNMEELRNA